MSDVRLTDSDSRRIRSREESNGLSSYRSSHDEYTPRGSKAKLDNDDIFNSSRTSSRNSRLLKDNNSFDESYTPSISRKRDASLPPMSRKDSSPLDSRPSLTGQNSISPVNANVSPWMYFDVISLYQLVFWLLIYFLDMCDTNWISRYLRFLLWHRSIRLL